MLCISSASSGSSWSEYLKRSKIIALELSIITHNKVWRKGASYWNPLSIEIILNDPNHMRSITLLGSLNAKLDINLEISFLAINWAEVLIYTYKCGSL